LAITQGGRAGRIGALAVAAIVFSGNWRHLAVPTFRGNGIQIYFEQAGARTNVPILLVHGVGCQLVTWPESFVRALVDDGMRVIMMDNRDCGLSQKMTELGAPDVSATAAKYFEGETIEPLYTLTDMARDACALLDHLGLAAAHVFGQSMGGMIAQRMAIHFPERVFSLVQFITSSGNRELPPPTPEAVAALLDQPSQADRESAIAQLIRSSNVLGGPHYLSQEVGIGRFVKRAFDRAYCPDGVARQLVAVVGDGSRLKALGELSIPTLVIHGDSDPLFPLEAGQELANAIPGATLKVIERLGHDLPEPLIEEIADLVLDHVHSAKAKR
jgi:pimeloyl-ACP methyl ester carboxylesterase